MQTNHVIETYSQGAPDYEAIVERYWHIERGPFIASLGLGPGQTALDAAVGTGLNLPATRLKCASQGLICPRACWRRRGRSR